MSLLLEPRTARPESAVVAPVGGRRRAVAVTVAVALMIGLVWLALPALVRTNSDTAVRMPVTSGLTVSEFGDQGVEILRYQHHQELALGFPVRNTGLLPLHITGVSLDSPALPLLVELPGDVDVSLGPGEETVLGLQVRFDNCRYYHERSLELWPEVVISGTTLGRGFEHRIALNPPLALHGQVILNCPDRTLVRGDDVRPH